ncbi:MAG: ABC transporter permease [Planctomycetota bacterium]
MPVLRFVASTLLTLFLVSGLTFPLLELHSDPTAEVLQSTRGDQDARQQAARVILERTGRIDPETGEERSLPARYFAWLGRVVQLDLAPAGETEEAFRRRFLQALGVSFGLALAAFLFALGLGGPLGVWLGMHHGRLEERLASALILTLTVLPSFVIATLLLLGLRLACGLDWPLVFAVVTLAAAPFAAAARLVHSNVRALESAPFIRHLRHQGASPSEIAGSLRLHALGAVRAQSGAWLPSLMTGSVIVESVFELPGLGRLFLNALDTQDVPTVLLVTTLSAFLVSIAWTVTDLWQRMADPRTRLPEGVG